MFVATPAVAAGDCEPRHRGLRLLLEELSVDPQIEYTVATIESEKQTVHPTAQRRYLMCLLPQKEEASSRKQKKHLKLNEI